VGLRNESSYFSFELCNRPPPKREREEGREEIERGVRVRNRESVREIASEQERANESESENE
jgi:hypothetical protein